MNIVKVKVSSFYNDLLDKFVGEISSAVFQSGGTMHGPIPMPTKQKRFVINRAPHVNKKSREVYYIRTHSRVLYIYSSGSKNVLQEIQNIAIAPGIGVDVKVVSK